MHHPRGITEHSMDSQLSNPCSTTLLKVGGSAAITDMSLRKEVDMKKEVSMGKGMSMGKEVDMEKEMNWENLRC